MKIYDPISKQVLNKAEHLIGIGRAWSLHVALCGLVVVPMLTGAADDPEFTVELTSTWQSQTTTNHHRTTVTCIVGSNGWFISGDFVRNARTEYWLVGTNVIEHGVITSSVIPKEEPPLGRGLVASYPNAGDTFTKIYPAPVGQPVFHGMEGVVWLAFCSENYLQQPKRQIPMPIGPSSDAFGYSDKTVLLQNDGGLPKSVELFATNGTPVCKYEVMETTNYLGRTFPVKFRVMQRGQPANGSVRSSSRTDLEGRVISVRPGKWPELPDEVRKRLEP